MAVAIGLVGVLASCSNTAGSSYRSVQWLSDGVPLKVWESELGYDWIDNPVPYPPRPDRVIVTAVVKQSSRPMVESRSIGGDIWSVYLRVVDGDTIPTQPGTRGIVLHYCRWGYLGLLLAGDRLAFDFAPDGQLLAVSRAGPDPRAITDSPADVDWLPILGPVRVIHRER